MSIDGEHAILRIRCATTESLDAAFRKVRPLGHFLLNLPGGELVQVPPVEDQLPPPLVLLLQNQRHAHAAKLALLRALNDEEGDQASRDEAPCDEGRLSGTGGGSGHDWHWTPERGACSRGIPEGSHGRIRPPPI